MNQVAWYIYNLCPYLSLSLFGKYFLHHLMVTHPPRLSSSIAHYSPLKITLQLKKLTHKCTDCWFYQVSYIFSTWMNPSTSSVRQVFSWMGTELVKEPMCRSTSRCLPFLMITITHQATRCLFPPFLSIITLNRLYLESMTRSWNGRFDTPCLSPS